MNDEALSAAKLEALAEFAAGAGHEINNPLAAISGRVQLLLDEETDPERRRHLLTIGSQALRIRDMISDVMLFARPPKLQSQIVNLAETIDDILSKFTGDINESNLTIEGDHRCDITVWADETQLQIVLSELLRNAIQFSPIGGDICVDVHRYEEQIALITISDQGPGLSHTDRKHLFDPFYSGRQAGRGLGFGLSKCWRIVTLHQGWIRLVEGTGFGIQVAWPTTPIIHPT